MSFANAIAKMHIPLEPVTVEECNRFVQETILPLFIDKQPGVSRQSEEEAYHALATCFGSIVLNCMKHGGRFTMKVEKQELD